MHAVSEDLKHWTKTQDAVTFVPQPGYDPDELERSVCTVG